MKKLTNTLKEMEHHKILKHLMIAVNFLFAVFLFLYFQNGLPAFWAVNFIYLFFVFVLINVLFFVSRINRIPEEGRKDSTLIYYFSHFFLLSLVIIVLNQFLKKEFISGLMTEITIVSIALGFLTFYAYRNRVEREIEDEQKREREMEEERAGEFGVRFPKMAKIPILRGLVRWMYKEGWAFSIPFVIIVTAFIVIKIGLPIVYTGSYIDEYFHIVSGIEFFKSWHFTEFYNGSYYMRGAYVSFLVGLFMYIFGQTIFVAKMLPATIGIINFFLLYAISRKFIKRKKYILLLMLIYTISPWVIFNHFYIRMFVFYELFLLLITWTFLKLFENIKKRDKKRIWIYSGIFIFINFINYFFSYDSGKYLIFVLSGLFILYLYLFEIGFGKRKKFIFLFLGIILLFFLFDVSNKVSFLIDSELQFTSPDDLKYDYYFFNMNVIFSILFIISLATIRKIKSKEFFIISSFLLLFLIHMISSKDLQILRGILYLFPAYYMISIFSISRLNSKNLWRLALCAILLTVIIYNYPENYISGPNIKNEIEYRDYLITSNYINNFINNDTLILTTFPQTFRFYNPSLSNNLFVIRDQRSSFWTEKLRYLTEEGWVYTPTRDPIVSSYEELENITFSNKDVLIVVENRNYKSMITEKSKKIIDENYYILESFEGVSIYKKLN